MFALAANLGKGLAAKAALPTASATPSFAAAFFSTVNVGRVKWFNNQKGYGFIIPDDGGEDLFVHQTSIYSEGYRSLAEGEEVEFEVYEEPGGRTKAVNVTGPNGGYVKGSPGPNDDFNSGSKY